MSDILLGTVHLTQMLKHSFLLTNVLLLLLLLLSCCFSSVVAALMLLLFLQQQMLSTAAFSSHLKTGKIFAAKKYQIKVKVS